MSLFIWEHFCNQTRAPELLWASPPSILGPIFVDICGEEYMLRGHETLKYVLENVYRANQIIY